MLTHNKIIQRLKSQAYSSNIPIGNDKDDIAFLIQEYNESDELIRILKLAQIANNPNRTVNLKFKYQLCYNYNTLTMNNSVFVTNNMKSILDTPINKNNIFVWDAFLLEMTKDSWH